MSLPWWGCQQLLATIVAMEPPPQQHDITKPQTLRELYHSWKEHEECRTNALQKEGRLQLEYPLSNDSYLRTLTVIQGRALDRLMIPFAIVMIHAVSYSILQQQRVISPASTATNTNSTRWEIFFSFVLNATLSLLLVFRLNRAAERFWIARQYWGDIVAYSRTISSGVLTLNANDDAAVVAQIVRYLAVWALATKDLLRKEKKASSTTTVVDANTYAGLLSKAQVKQLHRFRHPPMVVAGKLRRHLKELCESNTECISAAQAIRLDRLEEQLNRMIWAGGGLERIKHTPLPIVYVSHLRTFLLINLLLFPWVFGPIWGYYTIPIVAVSSYAWLGIEGAAAEVESPFSQHRVNALNMDGYVMHLVETLQEQLECHMEIEESAASVAL